MNLHEYQTKQLFTRYGLPSPAGYVCSTPCEAEEYALKISNDGPWVMKCQVHAGGRGKAGGVKVVRYKEEILTISKQWLGERLVTHQTNNIGQPIHLILVEEAIDIVKELYLGAVIDRNASRVVFMASTKGGVDIEKVAEETPHLIHKVFLDPFMGPQPYQGRSLAFKLGLNHNQVSQFSKIFMSIARLFLECDLSLVEINPLVITGSGDFVCLDGKLNIDNNALFRQPLLHKMRDFSQEDEREIHANKWGLNYVALDGNIGCMVNGAGLAMGTMDLIQFYGGKPANFLDVGGGVTKERVTQAFKIILSEKKIKAILVNIFGGIVRCDLIADGVIEALSEVDVNIPVVIRLEGNKSEHGIKRLIQSDMNIIVASNLTDAAQQVVGLSREE